MQPVELNGNYLIEIGQQVKDLIMRNESYPGETADNEQIGHYRNSLEWNKRQTEELQSIERNTHRIFVLLFWMLIIVPAVLAIGTLFFFFTVITKL